MSSAWYAAVRDDVCRRQVFPRLKPSPCIQPSRKGRGFRCSRIQDGIFLLKALLPNSFLMKSAKDSFDKRTESPDR